MNLSVVINVSVEHTVSIVRAEDGGSVFLRNVGICVQVEHGVTLQKGSIAIFKV
jgi:hypothetical protein